MEIADREKMETEAKANPSPTPTPSVVSEGGSGKAYCKCGEGWKCEIKRTQGPDAGKTFVTCGHNCICILEVAGDGGVKVQQREAESKVEGAFCECGEGWSCTISKIQNPEAAKPFADCAGDCSCITAAS